MEENDLSHLPKSPQKLATVASQVASNWTVLVLDKLEALSLSSLFTQSPFLQHFVPLFENLSTTSITTLLATLLALLFYVARALMHRSSFGQIYQNGGRSPYAVQAKQNPDRNISDLYEYVDDRHNILPPPHHRASQPVFEDDEAPDIIHVTYRGDSWPIEFPPYSIAEEKVTVKHVRDRVAERIGMHDQVGRVRLVYKDKDLRRNDMPLRKYGCKQNSEIAAIVSTESRDYSLRRYNSGSDSESGHASRRGDSGRRRRSESIYRRRDEEVPYQSNGYLHPLDTSTTSSPRQQSPNRPHMTRRDSPTGMSRPSLERQQSPNRPTMQRRDSPTGVSRPSIQRQQSPIRPSPQRAASPSTNAPRTTAPAVQPPRADPSTQLGKIQAMRYQFHTEYAPLLHRFIRSPPPDKEDRDKEYRRLNEIVYKMVFEKGDAIEPEGADKEEIRATRKQMYAEAQTVLKELDKFKPHTD